MSREYIDIIENEGTKNMTTITIDPRKPILHNYETGQQIRNATQEELTESIEAADTDGGAGVITVDGVDCYVED
jgi:hypothetical protein